MKKRALPVADEAKFLNMHKLSFQSFREERFEMISLMLEVVGSSGINFFELDM